MVEQRRERHEREGNDQRGNPRGNRGFSACLFRHCRARKAAGRRVALEQGTEHVGDAQGAKFLVGIHPVGVPLFDGFGHADGFHEGHQRQRQGGWKEGLGVFKAPRWKPKPRQALRNGSHHFQSVGVPSPQPRGHDAGHHHDEGSRKFGGPSLECHQSGDARDAHGQGGEVDVRKHLDQAAQKHVKLVASAALHAKQMGELVESNDQGGGTREPADDRPRQEMDQEPKLHHPHAPLQQPHHQGQKQRQPHVFLRTCNGHAGQTGGHQQAVHGHGAHREVT